MKIEYGRLRRLYEEADNLYDIEGVFGLPHGSGFDDKPKMEWDPRIIDATLYPRVLITFGYHYINEDGYYDGWFEFKMFLTELQSFELFYKPGAGRDVDGLQICNIPGEIKMDLHLEDAPAGLDECEVDFVFNYVDETVFESLCEKRILTRHYNLFIREETK